MTAFQHHAQYLRARDVLVRLRERRTPEALALIDPLFDALGDATGDRFAAMVAITREAEVMLGDRSA